MKYLTAIAVAMAVTASPAFAGHPYGAAPAASAIGRAVGGGSAASSVIAGCFIGGVVILIVAHEATRKRCNERHSTFVPTTHDINPQPVKWVDPCKRKNRGRAAVVARA